MTHPDVAAVLHGQLPRIGVSGNAHYAAGEYAMSGSTWRWAAGRSQAPHEWVRVASVSEEIYVGVSEAVSVADFDWRAYRGGLRLVAWAASHGYLLSLLEFLYCADFAPRSFVGAEDLPPSTGEQVEFVIERDGQPIATGICAFPKPLPVRAMPRPTAPAFAIPFRIPLVVDRLTVSAASLRELDVGAAICIRRRAFLDIGARLELRLGRIRLLVKVTGTRLIVLNVIANTQEDDMQTRPESSGVPPADLMPVSIDQLPVELCFEAGSIDVDLEQLSRMQPGFVFELEKPLSERTIRVVANGALIGYGELVVVGDQLGVRLTALCRSAPGKGG